MAHRIFALSVTYVASFGYLYSVMQISDGLLGPLHVFFCENNDCGPSNWNIGRLVGDVLKTSDFSLLAAGMSAVLAGFVTIFARSFFRPRRD